MVGFHLNSACLALINFLKADDFVAVVFNFEALEGLNRTKVVERVGPFWPGSYKYPALRRCPLRSVSAPSWSRILSPAQIYCMQQPLSMASHSPSFLPRSFALPRSLKTPTISPFKNHPFKPHLIICKISDSQFQQQEPFSNTLPAVAVSVSPPAPARTGAASPTRGDIFLQRQQSEANKKKKPKRKKKLDAGLIVSTAIVCCYGCGAPLQTSEVDAPGYVDPDTYALKKKHHQLRTLLCGRCKLLSHGHMITAVGGNGGYSGGKQFISAEGLREKLFHLRHGKVLIVKLVWAADQLMSYTFYKIEWAANQVDIVDFNGSFLARVRDLAGANPIILVVTKVDLLPKDTDLNCIGDWVVDATTKKKLNVLSVYLTSSKSMVGIAGVAFEIQKEKKYLDSSNKLRLTPAILCVQGRDVYILRIFSAFVETMAERDPVAAAARRYKPIQSAVPGTTLGPIQIDAFLGGGPPQIFDDDRNEGNIGDDICLKTANEGFFFPQSVIPSNCCPLGEKLTLALHLSHIFCEGERENRERSKREKEKVVFESSLPLKPKKLFDTPGVHLHHRQAAVVHSEDLPALAPQSRLRGRSFPAASYNQSVTMEPAGLNGLSLFWGGLVRIDILKVLPQTRLTFYGPKTLEIHTVPTTDAEEFYKVSCEFLNLRYHAKREIGIKLTPPTGKQKAENSLGLQTVRQLQIKVEDQRRPACDIAISGLGWIAVEPTRPPLGIFGSSEMAETTVELHLAVHVPKPVEIFVRSPMPVGKAGGDWYEYRELTEKEEESRPKWHF
ncbi:hypothetical protein ACLOJK_006168 [Asimina triloba]